MPLVNTFSLGNFFLIGLWRVHVSWADIQLFNNVSSLFFTVLLKEVSPVDDLSNSNVES